MKQTAKKMLSFCPLKKSNEIFQKSIDEQKNNIRVDLHKVLG
ncbi:hypothetical protein RV10_GL003091 [Enterococcus pallens]|nr:hypothetical protein RV10_GL003091 [Enterococcus pallens]